MTSFVQWLMSPLAEWHIASLQHKLAVGTVGAATAWYLHKYKQWPAWKVALASVGAAYGTSMVLNAARRFTGIPSGLPVAAPPGPGLTAGLPVYPQPIPVPPVPEYKPPVGVPQQPVVSSPSVGPLDFGAQGKKTEYEVDDAGLDGIFA